MSDEQADEQMSDEQADEQADEETLKVLLALAVPLWIDRLLTCPWETVAARARDLSATLASGADNVLFRSRKVGSTAKAFNLLAEGLACMAFAKDGVEFLGLKFEARHPLVLHHSYWREIECDRMSLRNSLRPRVDESGSTEEALVFEDSGL